MNVIRIHKLDLTENRDEFPELRDLCGSCVRAKYFCSKHGQVHMFADSPHGLRHICGSCLLDSVRRLSVAERLVMAHHLSAAQVAERLIASALLPAGTEIVRTTWSDKILYGLFWHAHALDLEPRDLLEGYTAHAFGHTH